jgi:hypothetical protein
MIGFCLATRLSTVPLSLLFPWQLTHPFLPSVVLFENRRDCGIFRYTLFTAVSSSAQGGAICIPVVLPIFFLIRTHTHTYAHTRAHGRTRAHLLSWARRAFIHPAAVLPTPPLSSCGRAALFLHTYLPVLCAATLFFLFFCVFTGLLSPPLSSFYFQRHVAAASSCFFQHLYTSTHTYTCTF